jgi:hypothetical protein
VTSRPALTSHRAAVLSFEPLAFAAPLLTLLVIAIVRKGAFFRPDIVVSPALVVGLALSTPEVRDWLREHPVEVLAGVAGTAWWIGDAMLSHHSVDSWRLPATWCCLAAAYGCGRCFPAAAKMVALAGTAITGVVLAAMGLALVGVRSTLWTLPDERSLRFAGPFTYPSAVGLFFVIALVASTECLDAARPSNTARIGANAGQAIAVLGIVATDSRGAVVGLAVALCFRDIRQRIGAAVLAGVVAAPLLLVGQRMHTSAALVLLAVVVAVGLAALPGGVWRWVVRVAAVPGIAVGGWLLLTQHHVVSGFDASWTERGDILRGASKVLVRHPLLGAGPDPAFGAHTLTGQAGIAYFTHNEPLEVSISIGVLGAVVLVVCALIVVRPLCESHGRLALPVLASVGAAGLVDFVWHFPALGLACGIVAGASSRRQGSIRLTP